MRRYCRCEVVFTSPPGPRLLLSILGAGSTFFYVIDSLDGLSFAFSVVLKVICRPSRHEAAFFLPIMKAQSGVFGEAYASCLSCLTCWEPLAFRIDERSESRMSFFFSPSLLGLSPPSYYYEILEQFVRFH